MKNLSEYITDLEEKHLPVSRKQMINRKTEIATIDKQISFLLEREYFMERGLLILSSQATKELLFTTSNRIRQDGDATSDLNKSGWLTRVTEAVRHQTGDYHQHLADLLDALKLEKPSTITGDHYSLKQPHEDLAHEEPLSGRKRSYDNLNY